MTAGRVRPVLEAREAALVYLGAGYQVVAVRDVNLRIAPGEFYGVTGPSGNGKSSLLYLLSGLRLPSAGQIVFRNWNYRQLGAQGLADLRRAFYGFVFQQHFLINYLSVIENVLIACPEDRNGGKGPVATPDEHLSELLDRLGLKGLLGKYPYELSGGQRQRVAVARALANRPHVLFADEPTASLDRAAAREVVRILEEYRGAGGTVVLVTHDRDVLRSADRVFSMQDGTLSSA